MLSANRLLPGRLPPYSSMVGVSTGRYARPATGSTEIWVHTPTLPLHSHDPFSQVSLPNSPGPGIVLKRHSCLPVFTSNARTRPFAFVLYRYPRPSNIDDPTMIVSFTTVGVAWRPISPFSRSSCLSLPMTTPTFRSSTPLVPND